MKTKEIEILLVEDNPYDAEVTIRALNKNRLANKLVHLTDGEQALNYLLVQGDNSTQKPGHIPKLILLDLKLPKIDGLELLKAIRNNALTKTIPVVILTSSKEESDLLDSYNLGVNSYIVKPVDFEQFIEVVNSLGVYWLLLNEYPGE